MNKKDVMILVALFGLWLLWGPIDRTIIKPMFFPESQTTDVVDQDFYEEAQPVPAALAPASEIAPAAIPDERPPVALREPDSARIDEPAPAPQEESGEDFDERTVRMETDRLRVTFSSRGGTIRDVLLKSYPARNEPDSEPIFMDFETMSALGIEGFAGLTSAHEFDVQELPGGGVRFSRDTEYGLRFVREIRNLDLYVFEVRDTFVNTAGHPLQLPAYGIRSGRMLPMPGVTTYGMFSLGVDTLSPAEKVKRWAKDIPKWLDKTTAGTIRHPLDTPVDWVAVKNKYFVQSLRPRDLAAENCMVYAVRDADGKAAEVWAALQFPSSVLATGESFSREMVYYVGPQKLPLLSELGFHQDQIMELGWAPIRFFATMLMWGLTHIYSLFGNYGVAIMLLTVIIRIFFWPLTHKGTESMRRMQELAPLMKALNEKHKDDPQKRQQAVMEMYKEHKVNPLGGCLPMIVQIPVFIGLFYLLRTAIELRYAGFLWIDDLSEPEGIWSDVLPLGGLNILPIFMAVTMYFQQKLTPMPSSGDERQQQMHTMMMRIMPLMMLVLLYNFAAGLALYWSTQNVLMIVQQVIYRRRLARKKAEAAATAAPAITGTPAPAYKKSPGKKGGKNA